VSGTDRAPLMSPAPAGDRGREVARRRRLSVENGALVLSWEDGRREVLAAPGEVVSATWVPGVIGRPQATVRETLELALADGRSLAVPLDDWLGADDRALPFEWSGAVVRPLDASGSTALRISGAAAVARALGVDVTSAGALSPGARDVAAGGKLPALSKLLLRLWVAPALVAMALILTGAGPSSTVVWTTGLLGAALLVSLGTGLALDVAADRTLSRGDLPRGMWRPVPVSATSRAHVRTASIVPGHEWLVVRDRHGRECWTPGPRLGGARTAAYAGRGSPSRTSGVRRCSGSGGPSGGTPRGFAKGSGSWPSRVTACVKTLRSRRAPRGGHPHGPAINCSEAGTAAPARRSLLPASPLSCCCTCSVT